MQFKSPDEPKTLKTTHVKGRYKTRDPHREHKLEEQVTELKQRVESLRIENRKLREAIIQGILKS